MNWVDENFATTERIETKKSGGIILQEVQRDWVKLWS